MRENGGEITISIFGKVTFVGDDDIFYDDADAFLDCIREELPYRDIQSSSSFEQKGTVYEDPETGKLYVVMPKSSN